MNDFTKEELEELVCALTQDLNKFGRPYHEDLLEKIQTMIDSHCEHEFVGYLKGVAAIPYCRKCQRAIFNDN